MKRLAILSGWRTWPAIALCVLVSACATGPDRPAAIEARAQEYLDLYLASDYAASYQFLTPAYRSSVTSVAYQRQELLRKVRYTSGELIDSDCSENVCKVRISLSYRIVSPVPGMKVYDSKTLRTDNWIWTEGDWYLAPET